MKKYLLFCGLIAGLWKLTAQQPTVFNNVALGESIEIVEAKLQNSATKLYRVSNSQPNFPLAKNTELHLICMGCKAGNKVVEEVAFTFADGKLSLILAHGNAIEAITKIRKDTADVFMQYQAYWEDLIVADTTADKVWIMSPEAAHPNLFAWDNPYLPSNGGEGISYNNSAVVPDFLEMGETLEKLKPALEAASSFSYTMELAPGDPNAQLQMDCFGIEYAGFPRKFEARFGDGKLNMVWILTGKGEEDRIRELLIDAYGDPIFKNEAWEVFEDWQVFLRKDKPEVLLLTKELGVHYKEDYFKQ